MSKELKCDPNADAFPMAVPKDQIGHQRGMTIRQVMIKDIAAGLCTHIHSPSQQIDKVVERAIKITDALIEAQNKERIPSGEAIRISGEHHKKLTD